MSVLSRESTAPVSTIAPSAADISRKISRGERIDMAEARWLWENASDAELRRLASTVRARFHELHDCTYLIMRIINYTNVCVAQCDYCAFYRLPGHAEGYVMSRDEVFAKIDELLALGGDLAAFNGGFNPHLPLSYYCDLFAATRLKKRNNETHQSEADGCENNERRGDEIRPEK